MWAADGESVTVDAGELTWPTDYNDGAREHAVNLLDIAEAGFVAGCAPARLPHSRELIGKPPRESLRGDDPDDDDPDDEGPAFLPSSSPASMCPKVPRCRSARRKPCERSSRQS